MAQCCQCGIPTNYYAHFSAKGYVVYCKNCSPVVFFNPTVNSTFWTMDEPMQTINITWNPDIEAYETSWPYNHQFIDWIKKNVPTNKRSQDFDRSRNPQWKWIFEKEILEQVLLPLMQQMYFPKNSHKYVIIDKKKVDEYNQGFQKGTAIDKDALSKEFRELVREAGIDTTIPDRKQYLRAAMYYHPDRRPELAAKMSRLNEIWTTVFEPRQQEIVA